MCEKPSVATGIQSPYDNTRDWHQCFVLILARRLYVVTIEHLKGEQEYGNRTWTTVTFLRLHLCREVVDWFVVGVTEQGVQKQGLKQKSEQLFIR